MARGQRHSRRADPVLPHRLQRLQMQIDRTRADGTTTGQRHLGPAIPRQHRPQHQNRGPHLAHDVIICAMAGQRMAGQRQHLPVLQRRDLGPQTLQQGRHGADIRQPRRIGQGQRLIGQQRRRHQRQTGILGPRNRYLTLQRAITLNNDLVHPSCRLRLYRLCCRYCRSSFPPAPLPAACAAADWPARRPAAALRAPPRPCRTHLCRLSNDQSSDPVSLRMADSPAKPGHSPPFSPTRHQNLHDHLRPPNECDGALCRKYHFH